MPIYQADKYYLIDHKDTNQLIWVCYLIYAMNKPGVPSSAALAPVKHNKPPLRFNMVT